MTSTDRIAEMAAEIERMNAAAEDGTQQVPVFSLSVMAMAMDEIRQLRARVAELETINAMIIGTVRAGIVGELDEPATITHNIPHSAPPHDE